MKNYIFLSVIFVVALHARSQSLSDTELVKKYVPSSFKLMKLKSTGKYLRIGAGIGFKFLSESFNNHEKSRYLISMYFTDRFSGDNLCEIKVVKIQKGIDTTLGAPSFVSTDASNGCSGLQAIDLDADGTNEILLSKVSFRVNDGPSIFKWTGNQLAEITPIKDGVSILRDFVVTDSQLDGLPLLIDYPFKEGTEEPGVTNSNESTIVFQLSGQNFQNKGSFEFIEIIKKDSNAPGFFQSEFMLAGPGNYFLEAKNVSTHKNSVQAEITVNGRTVLKPSEFCSDPGKSETSGSDGDLNEDNLRGCKAKSEVYVEVPLETKNTLTFKLYGKKKSRLQITLKKK